MKLHFIFDDTQFCESKQLFNIHQVALCFSESETVRDLVLLPFSGLVCVVQGHDVWNP